MDSTVVIGFIGQDGAPSSRWGAANLADFRHAAFKTGVAGTDGLSVHVPWLSFLLTWLLSDTVKHLNKG